MPLTLLTVCITDEIVNYVCTNVGSVSSTVAEQLNMLVQYDTHILGLYASNMKCIIYVTDM